MPRQVKKPYRNTSEWQSKLNIQFNWPSGRKSQAIGTRKKKVSGGRGKPLKTRSATGSYTGGGF